MTSVARLSACDRPITVAVKHAGAKGAHWMTSANGKAPQGATEARPLNWLWNKAVAEWAELDGKGTAA